MPRKKSTITKERMIHIRLTDKLHKQLKVNVALSGQTIQDWVTNLIEEKLKKQRINVVRYG